jgi:hypothetical protein
MARSPTGRKIKARIEKGSEYWVGDEHVKNVVLTYSRLMRGWDILIYLRNSCGATSETPRLCSIDLLPKKRIPFGQVKFSSEFTKKHVTAVDAAWDEYGDGSGLKYEVYSTKTPYGNELPSDLNRISAQCLTKRKGARAKRSMRTSWRTYYAPAWCVRRTLRISAERIRRAC